MRCRYRAPETAAERGFKRKFTAYTRGCMCGACVQVLYQQFGWGERSRIPLFVEEMHKRIDALDLIYGDDALGERDEMCRRLYALDLEYGKRCLRGKREHSAYVHDVMTMVALEVLVEVFRFGRRRTEDGEHGAESRLDRFFTELGRAIRYINSIDAGIYDQNDKFCIMFDDWIKQHLITYGFSETFVNAKIFKW